MPFLPTTTLINSTLNSIKTDTPYLALFTASPNAGGGGTEVGGSYARQAITYGTITSGSMANTVALTYTNLPNATITHYAVFNAVTGGTMKGYGALSNPAISVSGDQLQIPIGAHTISLTGS